MQAPEFFKCVYELNTDLVSINLSFLAGIVWLVNMIEYINFTVLFNSNFFILPNVLFLGDFKASAELFVFSLA